MKSVFLFFICAFLFFQANSLIYAQPGCSHYSPEMLLKRFEFVFTGKVLDYTEENGREFMSVKVSENFRGAENQESFKILPANDGCEGKREVGKTYLFAVNKNSVSSFLVSNSISGEYQSETNQRQFIEYLRWKKSNRTDSVIAGSALTQSFRNGIGRLKPDGLNKVFLQNEDGKIFAASIEPDGFYKFDKVKPGKYSIFVKLPDGLRFINPNTPEKTSLIVENGKFIFQNFSFGFIGSISGKITNSANAPLSSMLVVLYFIDKAGKETMFAKTETGQSGTFKFEELMPGNYIIETFPVISAEIAYPPKVFYADIKSEFPAIFFPNARNKNQAVRIRLEPGKNLTDIDIRLESLLKRLVRGRVFYADGTPAQDAEILIKISRTANKQFLPPESRFEKVTSTDKDGSFSFAAYNDTKYRVQAVLRKSVQGVIRLYESNCAEISETGEIPALNFLFAERFLIGRSECAEPVFY